MYKTVSTSICIQEIPTGGHSPSKFICDDGNMYFVKYLSGKSFKKDEIHCLVFEWVCSKLLIELGIQTPQIALVIITEDSIAPGTITINKRTFKDGVIGFGSQEITNSDLARVTETIKSKKDFNRFGNPEDLIKIAIFDLWVDNADRNESNLNLLIHSVYGKMQFAAIDHAFTFGGLDGMRIFHEKTEVHIHRKLINSPYFKSMVRFIPKTERARLINESLTLIRSIPIIQLLDDAFSEIPETWVLDTQLKKRMEKFLGSPERLQQVEYQTKNCLLNHRK